jgi:hypothetical protein
VEIADIAVLAFAWFVNGAAFAVIALLAYAEYKKHKAYAPDKRDKYVYYRDAYQAEQWYKAQRTR